MKIGIVGTHGIGKTTLAYSLASLIKREGHNAKVVNEVVRRCPFPLNDGFTINGAVWTICEQVRKELEAVSEGSSIIVCDRSALDPIFYLKALNFERELYAELEAFAINWLSSYSHLLWLLPIQDMPLFSDGVRSVSPDFQIAVHQMFSLFFEEHKEISYVPISSEDVFGNNLEKIVESLCLKTQVAPYSPLGSGCGK